ncbi:MAG TPA: hypothetical protein VFC07_03405 [Verrucomicrobiae bacterium]|nr:hypothetical protein [Verrucomicrobiae bacterium]
MKKPAKKIRGQPAPFTPGITKGMVRQHAFELFRDRLPNESLTLEDWVLAEKDLVQTRESDGLLER